MASTEPDHVVIVQPVETEPTHSVPAAASTPEIAVEEHMTGGRKRLSTLNLGEHTKLIPVSIIFQDVRYEIKVKDSEKPRAVLNSLSGVMANKTMTAIMGPTGSGKTSLLNVIANRMPLTKDATLSGTLMANKEPVEPLVYGRLSSYVMQDDAMNAFLTVKETLSLAASFQLPSSVTKDKKEVYVDAVINELGLMKAATTLIGNELTRGVSGGERKRTNIGVELIKNPSMLFLDEPTSGLDSFQAMSVMECMADLALNGRTIVTSIHQPRSAIYAMFDRLYLISEGNCIYQGPANQAVAYFGSKGGEYQCPPLFNPADFFLDITSPDYRSPEQEAASLKRVEYFTEQWKHAPLVEEKQASESGMKKDKMVELKNIDVLVYQTSVMTQIMLVYWRAMIAVRRNKIIIFGKLLPPIIFGLIIGAIYSDTKYNQSGIQDRIGVLFFCIINQMFGNMIASIKTFSQEKVILERERASKSYRLSSFYIGKYYAELPFNVVPPCIFSCIVYWTAGLNSSISAFGNFVVFMILIGSCAVGIGIACSTFTGSEEAASAAGPGFVVIMILFGGFYINVDSLPQAVRWLNHLALTKYSFAGLTINEFTGVEFTCESSLAVEGESGPQGGQGCIRTGEEVIRNLSFEGQSVEMNMLALFIYLCVLHLVSFLGLLFAQRKFQPLLAPKGHQS